MTKLQKIESVLKEQKSLLKNKYKVKELGIFGSYVRNEYSKRSDLDLLVEFYEIPGLLRFLEIENYLSEAIGLKVDLVMKDALKPPLKNYILKEVRFI